MKIRNGFVSNSSSSSFICSSKINIKNAKNKLKDMLELYNKLYGTELLFENVFQKPFKIEDDKKSKEYVEEICSWIFGRRSQNCYRSDVSKKEDLKGKLVINSADDN